MLKQVQVFAKYEVPANRRIEGGWQSAEDKAAGRDIRVASLLVEMTGDGQCVILQLWKVDGPDNMADAPQHLAGEFSLDIRDSLQLGVALAALVPSGEDRAGSYAAGSRIGIRFPVGMWEVTGDEG